MTELGFITRQQLAEIERLGITPGAAVNALIAEAEARHPSARGIQIRRDDARGGFAIMALRMDGASQHPAPSTRGKS